MRRWPVLAVALLLLLALGQTVLAQGGEGGRVIFGQDYTLGAGQRLDGDLVVFGGRVVVEYGATVRGAVTAFGGTVHIAGRVDGDVTALGGEVSLAETADVAGKVVTAGGSVDDRRAGRSRAPVEKDGGAGRTPGVWPWTGAWASEWLAGWHGGLDLVARMIIWVVQTGLLIVTMGVVGVLVVVMVPGLAETAGQTLVVHPAESVGAGLLTGVAIGLVAPVLVITCVGIPVAAILVLGLALAGLFGWVVTGLTVGRRLLEALHRGEGRPVAAVVAGVSVLTLLARMPGLGPLFAILLGAWGLGAVVLTRFGTIPYRGSRAGPVLPAALPGDMAGDGG